MHLILQAHTHATPSLTQLASRSHNLSSLCSLEPFPCEDSSENINCLFAKTERTMQPVPLLQQETVGRGPKASLTHAHAFYGK